MALFDDPRVGANAMEGTQYPDEPEAFDAPGGGALQGEPIMNEDGSATVPMDEAETPDQALQQFDVNLADHLPEHELSKLAERYMFELDADKTSRRERDERYAKAIKQANLDPYSRNDGDSGGASFDGASIVGHPAFIEACIDFGATAIKELYPVSGPVKMHVPGVATKEVEQRAARKKAFLNWQLSEHVGYRPKLETMLSQLPYTGNQYIKCWFNRTKQRLAINYVPDDEVLLAYGSDNLESSPRVTHQEKLNKYELRDRVESGLYRDLKLIGAIDPDKTPSEVETERVQGKSDPGNNIDEQRIVFELSCHLEDIGDPLVPEERSAPYLVSIDETSRKILAIYRNWQPDDKLMERLDWLIEWPFIPWRGGSIGLGQIIGSLSIAARGALRALLDSAHVNNFPGGVRIEASGASGQNVQVNPMELTPLKAPASIDDIRKIAMPFPFNPPSAVLFQLLGWLTDAMKGVITTAEEKIADASSQMPVGTALALIEQGAKVFSAIHSRLHAAQHRFLKLVCMINRQHPPLEAAKKAKLDIQPEDFAQNDDVIPVSDPNIFSEAQRYAQLQAAMQLSQDQSVQYDHHELHRRALEMLKIPEPEGLLPPVKKPQPLNPAAENVQMVSQAPAIAFPDQDHRAHLEVHLRFFADPFLGGSPYMLQKLVPQLVEHVTQHVAFMYGAEVNRIIEQALGMPVLQAMQDPNNGNKLDKLCASASILAQATVDQQLNAVKSIMDRLFHVAQSLAVPPMEDPAVMAARVADKDVTRRIQKDAADADLAHRKLDDAAFEAEADRTSNELINAAKVNTDAVRYLIDISRSRTENLEDMAHEADQGHADRMAAALDSGAQRSHDATQAEADRQHALGIARLRPRPTAGGK